MSALGTSPSRGSRANVGSPPYLGTDRGIDLADDPVDGDARLGPGQRPALGLAVGLALRLAFRHSLNSR